MFANLAEDILQHERNDTRFEAFCIAICSAEQGTTFVPTSKSWDRGRDGRTVDFSRQSHRAIICATLNSDIDQKVESDITRLTATSSPEKILYSCSQSLSEHKCDDIRATLVRHAQNASIVVLGAKQLGELAARHQAIFEQFYGAEVAEIRRRILDPEPDADNKPLRLALLTFGSPEGGELREEVLSTTLLGFLSDTKGMTDVALAKLFSDAMRLRVAVSDQAIRIALNREVEKGRAIYKQGGWWLTELGIQHKKLLPVEASAGLLKGKTAIATQLHDLLGMSLSTDQLDMFWSGLLDLLAHLFHSNGLSLVLAVQQLLTSDDGLSDDIPDLREILSTGAARVVSFIQNEDLKEAAEQAIIDIFTERTGIAFDWLTKVSERFVILCSLGLEHTSSSAVKDVLLSNQLVLDSDVVLDILCPDETEARSTRRLLTGWLRLGGKVLIAPVTLEEIAHHAWISGTDFKETLSLLGKLDQLGRQRYIRNAFVRSYHSLEKTPARWDFFISQYRGNTSKDYGKILAAIRDKIRIESLPDVFDFELADNIVGYLLELRNADSKSDEQYEDLEYKAKRDGRLMASIAKARNADTNASSTANVVLLSSSRLLRMTDKKFRTELGGREAVLPKGALSLILATIPDASLGADTLQRNLFDFGSRAPLYDLDRRALRILKASGEIDIPWAGRAPLREALAQAIKREANVRDRPEAAIRRSVEESTDPDTTSRIIVDAVRALAVPAAVVKENAKLKEQNSNLQKQLGDLNKIDHQPQKRIPRRYRQDR